MKILRTVVICNAAFLLICTAVACHRSYYRRQADAEATRLIEEKSLDPHWSIPGYTIEVDPASRMFDPFSQDHPPMPPDDPAASEFMHEVDGKPAYPHWHANGDTPYVENPEWKYYLPLDENGKLVVDINTAVELALLHSPDYQRELENLYLSALAVSLERFDFESQFFAPFGSIYTASGSNRPAGTNLRINNQPGAQLRKAGITGSNLIVSFANSILWQYSGDNSTIGFGSLSFELIQPLLRNAGRDVILESLTDAERGLLYNVRQLERFRRGYMQSIAVGFTAGGGVDVGSGFFRGIPGIARGAGGALGLLETQQNIRIQESNITSQRSLLEQFEEYYRFQRIDLLQLKQFKNSVYNSQSALLATQVSYLNNLDDYKITLGLPPDIELEINDPILEPFNLINQDISDRQDEVSNLRKTASQTFLDITEVLAIPLSDIKIARDRISAAGGDPATDLSWAENDIDIDKQYLVETKSEDRIYTGQLTGETDDKITILDDFGESIDIPKSDIKRKLSLREMIQSVLETLRKIEPIYKAVVEEDFPRTERDIENLKNSLAERRARLLELQDEYFNQSRDKSETPVIEEEVLRSDNLEQLVTERNLEFNGGTRINDQGKKESVVGVKVSVTAARNELTELLRIWETILANDGGLPAAELAKEPFKSMLEAGGDPTLKDAVRTRAGTIRRFISEPGPEVLTKIKNLIIDVSLIQALARVDSLTLPVVEIEWQDALEIARVNRRDWMNARAQLVDQWRRIEVVADDLESQLDLTFGGDLQNLGNNPWKLRGSNGQIRIGLQFDAPITRLAERNNYRSVLIAYQRSKRQYYQFEDQIAAQIREIIRELELSKLDFEISRIQVKNSVDEVQLASYALVRPPRPGSGSSQVGFQVARDLINALRNLLLNQNALIRNWVRFEVLRRQLDFNMGTMQIDGTGNWIDPVRITTESIRSSLEGQFVPGMSTDENIVPEAESNAPIEMVPPMGQKPVENRLSGNQNQSINQQVSMIGQSQLERTDKAEKILSSMPEKTRIEEQVQMPKKLAETQTTIEAQPEVSTPRSVRQNTSLYSNFDRDLQRGSTLGSLPSWRPTNEKGTRLGNLPNKSESEVANRIMDQRSDDSNNAQHESKEQAPKPKINPFPYTIKK